MHCMFPGRVLLWRWLPSWNILWLKIQLGRSNQSGITQEIQFSPAFLLLALLIVFLFLNNFRQFMEHLADFSKGISGVQFEICFVLPIVFNLLNYWLWRPHAAICSDRKQLLILHKCLVIAHHPPALLRNYLVFFLCTFSFYFSSMFSFRISTFTVISFHLEVLVILPID